MTLEHMITGKRSKGVKAVVAGLAVATGLTSAGCVSPFRNLDKELGLQWDKRRSATVEVQEYPVGEYLTKQGIPMIRTMADYQKALKYKPEKLHVFYNYPCFGSESMREANVFVRIVQRADVVCFSLSKGGSDLVHVKASIPTNDHCGVIITRDGRVLATGSVQQIPSFLQQYGQ